MREVLLGRSCKRVVFDEVADVYERGIVYAVHQSKGVKLEA